MSAAVRSSYIFIVAVLLLTSCRQTTEQLIEKGNREVDQNKFEDAVRTYSKAILRNKEFQLPYYYRGVAYSRSKHYKEALNDFNTVINMQYGNIDGPVKMRFTYNKQSPFATEEAKMQASYEKTLYERALVYYYMGAIDSARQNFTELVELKYEKGNCLLWLAAICIGESNTNEACTYISQAVYAGLTEEDRLWQATLFEKYCKTK